MKEQLIEQLTAALQTEDIMSVRDTVRGIRNQWKSETVKERQLQLEAFKTSEPEENVEFIYQPHESEGQFQELCKQYEDRIEEAGKVLAAERQKNYDAKLNVLTDFQKLIQEEDLSKTDHHQNHLKFLYLSFFSFSRSFILLR